VVAAVVVGGLVVVVVGDLACAGHVTVPPLITYAKATPAPTTIAAANAPNRRAGRLPDLVLTL
jgi:hypothetical protein